MPTTTEYWSIKNPKDPNTDVSLAEYCWNIKTLGGSRSALPSVRGDNIQYPFSNGRRFRPKKFDSRVITLLMWVAGVDPATNQPRSSRQDVQFNDNLDKLQQLFWSPSEQLTLTRRWLKNPASPTLITASAKCELAGTMDPAMTGRTRADLTVDLLLADPCFYGPVINTNLTLNTPVNVVNPGDENAYVKMTITFTGELWTPRITNSSDSRTNWIELNTIVPSTDSVVVDVGNFSAVRTFNQADYDGAVRHNGYESWFLLKPGTNTLTLTALGASSGSASISFQPPYL